MYKFKYNKKILPSKMRLKTKYKFSLNLFEYIALKFLVGLIASLSTVFFYVEFYGFFKETYISQFGIYNLKFYWVIIIFILGFTVFFYFFNKSLQGVLSIRMTRYTMRFLGVEKPFSECDIELKNIEYIEFSNENIENRIYYTDIKKITKKKKVFEIKYMDKRRIILPIGKYSDEVYRVVQKNWNNSNKVLS